MASFTIRKNGHSMRVEKNEGRITITIDKMYHVSCKIREANDEFGPDGSVQQLFEEANQFTHAISVHDLRVAYNKKWGEK